MTEANATAEPVTLTYNAVYAGHRWLTGTGLVARWYKTKEDGTPDENKPMSFAVKGKKTSLTNAWIGDVYTINEMNDGFRTDGLRKRVFHVEDTLQRWRLEDRAADAQSQMESKQKKTSSDVGGMTLKELAEQYEKTIGIGRRAALLAAIIQAVTG